jgi:hypothetical protein
MGVIFRRQRGEFQSQASTGLYVPDDGCGPDLSFLNKEVKFNLHTDTPRRFCFDK